MKIIIVGAGVIGSNLAGSLTEEGHEVYLVEANESTANRIHEKLDVKVVTGSGADPDTLRQVGIDSADMVVAVTTSDETNLVVCSLSAAFGVPRRIARVRSNALGRMFSTLGYERFYIDEIINPERVAAETIVRTIETPGAREVADFAHGKILLRAFDVPESSPVCGMKVEALREEDFPWPFLIIAIIRNKEVVVPSGETTIHPEDRIYTLLPAQSLGEFLSFINPQTKQPQKVIIYGATKIGESVAATLCEHIKDVTLVEEDADLAQGVAGRLEGVRVINGSAAEADILKECGIEAADAFIAASSHDHSNLVSAVLAKRMGAGTTIITTKQPDYTSIVEALDIDVIINPRFLATDQIIRLVRGKGISAMTKLMECDTEAIELMPEAGSTVTKTPINKIKFPKNSIVGAVCSGTEVFLANGDTQIQEGERVIVFCPASAVKKLQALFTNPKNV